MHFSEQFVATPDVDELSVHTQQWLRKPLDQALDVRPVQRDTLDDLAMHLSWMVALRATDSAEAA